MAEKRMFTMKIVDSDAFLEMPLSTQALYFHLNMRADDDGFVNNPKKICRIIGAKEDDLKMLLMKAFVLVFESGVIVIKHWRMNNVLRNDRYNPTSYQEELNLLTIKDNKSYTWKPNGNQTATTWQPNGNHLEPQYSIDKNSIDLEKNSIDIDKKYIVPSDNHIQVNSDVENIFNLWNECKITVHKTLTEDMIKAINKALSIYGLNQIGQAIKHYFIVFKDNNYFFDYKWKLVDFLKQSNALPTFLDEGDKWVNYNNSKQGKKSKEKELLGNKEFQEEILNDFCGDR